MLEALQPYRILIAPGLHNSGPGHWQSHWERMLPQARRIVQDDWSAPDLPRWTGRVDEVRGDDPGPTLILAHSFGCLAAVRSVAARPGGVAGLLLVAPADPDKFGVAGLLPRHPLPVPSILIASTDDPWMDIARASAWAQLWGAEFVDAGPLGHINSASHLGDWTFGQRYAVALTARLSRDRSPATTPTTARARSSRAGTA